MKATIYTTNEYTEYVSKPLTSGVSLSGITTINESTALSNSDFIGTGVAITGSSCYNLSKLDSDIRHKLLYNLYSKDGLNFNIGRQSIGASD